MTAHGQRGAASIEFAIVGLVFLSLLMLAMDAGWQLVINSALGVGARAAARFGTTGVTVAAGITPAPTESRRLDCRSGDRELRQSVAGRPLANLQTSYANFAAVGGAGGTAGPGSAGQVVLYTFTYTQPYLTPIAMTITGASQVVHTLQLVVLNEPFPEN